MVFYARIRDFLCDARPARQVSNERTIWKYIADVTGYSWDYGRTQIELRAWARLLFVNKRITCIGARYPMTGRSR